MSAFFMDVANNWLNVISFGVVDYVMEKFVNRPLAGVGMVGSYLAEGLGFQAKLSVASNNPLGAIRSGLWR